MKKTTNPLALAVLVHLFETPRHPYELAVTMKERGKEQSIRLNYGALYTVIDSLEKSGYIRALKKTRDGRRPEKTVYEITAIGESYMFQWMRELIATPVKEFPRFEAALSLLPVLAPAEAIALLESRMEHLKKLVSSFKDHARLRRDQKLPRLFSIESEYYEEMTKTELRYVEGLLKDIRSNADGLITAWNRIRKQVERKKS